MITKLGLVVMACAFALASPAFAKTKPLHTDTVHRFSVALPASFVFQEGEELLGSYSGSGKIEMRLSRVSFSSLPAWRKKERKAFLDTVVAGARSAAKGFALKSRSEKRVDRVPTMDLHFSRQGSAGEELVWMRFLFLRKHTIVATASTPASAKGSIRRQAKEFARSLGPLADPTD